MACCFFSIHWGPPSSSRSNASSLLLAPTDTQAVLLWASSTIVWYWFCLRDGQLPQYAFLSLRARDPVLFIFLFTTMPMSLSLEVYLAHGESTDIWTEWTIVRTTALLPHISNAHHDFKALMPLHFQPSPGVEVTCNAVFSKQTHLPRPQVLCLKIIYSLLHPIDLAKIKWMLNEEYVWNGTVDIQRASLFHTSCLWFLQWIILPHGNSHRRVQAWRWLLMCFSLCPT